MRRDDARLLDMLLAAQDAVMFVSSLTREAFDGDRKTQYAVSRALEIVGEAASKVTDDTRERHPDIPWSRIVGMRTFLAHEYFQIDLDAVWSVITTQLESLIGQLKAIVPPEASQSERS